MAAGYRRLRGSTAEQTVVLGPHSWATPISPVESWRQGPSRSTPPCSFSCPGFQAPVVFVQIRVRLLYKPHSSSTGHPAAASLTSPAGLLFAVGKQTALNKPLGRQAVEMGAAGNRKIWQPETGSCPPLFANRLLFLNSLSLKINK